MVAKFGGRPAGGIDRSPAQVSDQQSLTTRRLRDRLRIFARIKQPMEMNDEIAHVRIIDGLLRLRFPSRMRRCVVRKYADGLDFCEVLEGRVLEIDEFAADDEMKQLRPTGA